MPARMIIRLALSTLLLVLVAPLAGAQSVLDGRKFDTQAGFVGKPAHVKQDILSFDAGMFRSSDCDQYGYGTGKYVVRGEGNATAFEVETISAEYGRNIWKGVVKSDAIEGTMVFYRKPTWWRPNPEPLEHWFKGRATQ
jgi:hypothetical protein